jgi:intraflagellar transport protein 80
VTVVDERKIQVLDVLKANDEQLGKVLTHIYTRVTYHFCFAEFRDRIVKVSLRFGHLIVATAMQCLIYNEKNWNTPAIIDLTNSGRVTCIQQCASCFVLVDTYAGIQVFTYDGKLRSSPKYPGLRAEFLTPQNISISKDLLAVKDRADETSIHLFDVNTGSSFGEGSLKHSADILEIGLSQLASSTVRHVTVLDKNRELHISSALKSNFKKIGMCLSL